MSVAWERMGDLQETVDAVHQLSDGGITMIAGNGVMECFPKPLNAIDPGVVGRLEEQANLRCAASQA